MWNPEVSNIKLDNWAGIVNHFPFDELSWSVWEHEKVVHYDRFYMVRVGYGYTGIVMKGYFCSSPKRGDDWSNKGRDVYYCNLNIQHILDPEIHSIITTEELQKEIPTFDWTSGHSGRVLAEDEANKLDALWDKFATANPTLVEQQNYLRDFCIEKAAAEKIVGFEYLVNYFKEYLAHTRPFNPDCVYMKSYYHDTCNLGFSCDYNSSEFRLRYILQEAVLPIVCKKLHKLEMNLDDGSSFMDWFRISLINGKYFKLEANGIEVICDEIHFEQVEEYTEEYVPVCI